MAKAMFLSTIPRCTAVHRIRALMLPARAAAGTRPTGSPETPRSTPPGARHRSIGGISTGQQGPVGTVEDVIDVSGAMELAEAKLAASLPRRWRHVRSVARRARWAAKQLSLSDALVAAAWLHDIGYAPDLVETGFHPLDGARFLREAGIDGEVVSLVAYHSCAEIEADVRGLGEVLASEFKPGEPVLTDALLYCDMTTGPD